jgi:multimeric flavodoxin WrbA
MTPVQSRPLKSVTVFVGSGRKKGATRAAASRFLERLQSFGDVRGEIVFLGDYDLGLCRGCKICFMRGEERRPLKGDRDALIGKMMASDGVVFASPNYSFQVSAIMKAFLDRLGFLLHRPRFHGKTLGIGISFFSRPRLRIRSRLEIPSCPRKRG